MAEITKLLYYQLKQVGDAFYRDPRVQHLPLVGSPFPVAAIVIVYVLFVKVWGPQWMNDRKPFDVKLLIRLHNVLQILVNGYAFTIGVQNSYYKDDFSLTCRSYDATDTSPSILRLLHATYIYYLTKYLDLFDTVFFVLRKKNSHVSFLHVYHHVIMVFAVWLYLTLMFGSHALMLGILNSFVHVVMYSYYLLSSMDLKIDLLAWKKRITQIQILQFCYLTFHFAMPLINNWCNSTFNYIHTIAVIQNIFMASMFVEFYYKAYIKKDTNKNKLK